MPASLISLPYEILSYIVDGISFEDVISLARTFKHMQYLERDERTCSQIALTKIRHSKEVLDAIQNNTSYARALRLVAKRRTALATASPFSICTIGLCSTYLYTSGVLCYIIDHTLRILTLHSFPSSHSPANSEIVIHIPNLLRQTVIFSELDTRATFKILNYADSILACLYRSTLPEPTNWLIVFNVETGEVPLKDVLTTTEKIVVRHNAEYLYYATHSEYGSDGYKKWVLRGYCFATRKFYPSRIHLSEIVGCDLGTTIVMCIIGDYFYVLSNQTSFKVEEIDRTSFYHGVRWKLNDPRNGMVERVREDGGTGRKHGGRGAGGMWRREHREGPIDDRWTVLGLERSEENGALEVVEQRREWRVGRRVCERCWYVQPVVFQERVGRGEEGVEDDGDEGEEGGEGGEGDEGGGDENGHQNGHQNGHDDGNGDDDAESSSEEDDEEDPDDQNLGDSTSWERDVDDLPDSPLRRAIREGDHPNYGPPGIRLPSNYHPVDDGTSVRTFNITKTPISYYHSAANAFVDLVDDPVGAEKQRLRLRIGKRGACPPPLKDEAHKYSPYDADYNLLLPPHEPEDGRLKFEEEKAGGILNEEKRKEIYRDSYKPNEISFWPPEPGTKEAKEYCNPKGGTRRASERDLEALYKMLNPPSHLGGVEGTCDERSMVFVTGERGKGGARAIVFVSFDAGIRLEGLRKWGVRDEAEGGMREEEGEAADVVVGGGVEGDKVDCTGEVPAHTDQGWSAMDYAMASEADAAALHDMEFDRLWGIGDDAAEEDADLTMMDVDTAISSSTLPYQGITSGQLATAFVNDCNRESHEAQAGWLAESGVFPDPGQSVHALGGCAEMWGAGGGDSASSETRAISGDAEEKNREWLTRETPMYKELGLGFDLSR